MGKVSGREENGMIVPSHLRHDDLARTFQTYQTRQVESPYHWDHLCISYRLTCCKSPQPRRRTCTIRQLCGTVSQGHTPLANET
jgi:endonuclease III